MLEQPGAQELPQNPLDNRSQRPMRAGEAGGPDSQTREACAAGRPRK